MGCTSSKSHPKRRSRRRRRKTVPRRESHVTMSEEEFKVPAYQADLSEFEGEGHTYRSELYQQDDDLQLDNVQDHTVQSGFKFKQATYDGIHNIRIYPTDKAECRVRGAEFLPNGHLLICDQTNQKLKLFNAAFKYLSHYSLSGSPHELCVHSSDREGSDVYVTIPSERTIQEFFIEDHVFVKGQTIRTDGWCYGIAPYKLGLVVGIGTKIAYMDTEGHVLKTLQYDLHGDSMFDSPFHIAVTPDNNLVVSDLIRQCLVCVTPDANILYRYSHLTIPHGVFVDNDGYAYLCGANPEAIDTLHQISSKGEKVKSLLSWRHVGFRPDTVCFRERDQILAVCGESDRIKTFRLETSRGGRTSYCNDAVMTDRVPETITGGRSTPEVQQEMKQILRS